AEAGGDPGILHARLLRVEEQLGGGVEVAIVEREVRGDQLLVRAERPLLLHGLERLLRARMLARAPEELDVDGGGDLVGQLFPTEELACLRDRVVSTVAQRDANPLPDRRSRGGPGLLSHGAT